MAVCSVEGCDHTVHALGYCNAHYIRVKRYGDPGEPEVWLRDPSRICSIEGCGRPYDSVGLCEMHYQRQQKDGDPGEAAPRRQPGEVTSYGAAHRLLRRARGPASDRLCVDCGRQAQQWSYQGGSPRELMASWPWNGVMRTVAFSPDPNAYEPRCRSCHWRHDRGR